jgi:serine/threonine-protein kinase
VLLIVGVVVGMGLLNGKPDTTAGKGQGGKKAKVVKVASPTTSKTSADMAPEERPSVPRQRKKSAFDEPPIPVGEGFAVRTPDGEVSKEATLKMAMRRAIGSKGRVVLNNKEPLKLTGDDALINISGGTLVIEAEKGTQPVLEVEIKGGLSWLTTRGETPLRLAGVTVVARYTGGGEAPPPVIFSGSRVTLERCVFRASGAVAGCSAVAVQSEALSATGCFFENFDRALDFSAFAGPGAIVKQCMMVLPKPKPGVMGWAVRVSNLPGGRGKLERKVVMERCTVKGKGMLDLVGFSADFPCNVQVKECAVLADNVFAWEPAKKGESPLEPSALHWSGVGNRYDVQSKSWVVLKPDGSEPLPDGPADLSSWNQRFADRLEGGPIKFQTATSELPAENTAPIDFALTEQGDFKVGADPDLVGPAAKGAPR